MLKLIDTNSFFIKKIIENRKLIVISFLLALILFIITYPGIYYSDSYERISVAKKITHSILNFHPTNMVCRLTVIQPFFMALVNLIGSISLYTLFQAFFYFLLSFLLIKKLNTKYRFFQYLLFLANPILLGIAVWNEPNTALITGLIAIMLVAFCDEQSSKADKVILFGIVLISSFVLFGYRQNSLTVLPVILALFAFNKWSNFLRGVAYAAVIGGLLLSSFVPMLFHIKQPAYKAASVGVTWEILETIQNTENNAYYTYLDDIAGEGTTELAIQKCGKNSASVNCFLWDTNFSSPISKKPNIAILKKYFYLMKNEPKAFFSTKMYFISRTLGIYSPLYFAEYDYNRWDKMSEFHFKDTVFRKFFVDYVNKATEKLQLFARPFVVFILSFIMLFFSSAKNRKINIVMFLLAIFYYGAFLINNQAFELRYFIPSLYLLFIMCVSIIADLIYSIKNGILSKNNI